MELSEIYYTNKTQVSFEIFPPASGDISELFDELRILKKYNPALVSLTYGSDNGTRDFSFDILRMILDLEMTPMPHFTCMCSTKELIEHYIVQIENMGIENILALRGNKNEEEEFCSLDFRYAYELVEYIKEKTTLSIGVAGYPEGHPESDSLNEDIDNLKRKIDEGASAVFTKMFFDNDKFYKYADLVRGAGIEVPIIAGIMPVRSLTQVEKMLDKNIVFPDKLREDLENNPDETNKIGIEFAIEQCRDLIDNGVKGIHFYTLNHSDMVSDILDNIEI